jgi:hypothetical protein
MSAYSIVQIPGWETLSLHPRDHSTLERRLNELAHGSVPAEVPRDSAATPSRRPTLCRSGATRTPRT